MCKVNAQEAMAAASHKLPHSASSAESMLKVHLLQHLFTSNLLTSSRKATMRHLPAFDTHMAGNNLQRALQLTFGNNAEGKCSAILPDEADQEVRWQTQSGHNMQHSPAAPCGTPRPHLASAMSRALWGCRGLQSQPDGSESVLQRM